MLSRSRSTTKGPRGTCEWVDVRYSPRIPINISSPGRAFPPRSVSGAARRARGEGVADCNYVIFHPRSHERHRRKTFFWTQAFRSKMTNAHYCLKRSRFAPNNLSAGSVTGRAIICPLMRGRPACKILSAESEGRHPAIYNTQHSVGGRDAEQESGLDRGEAGFSQKMLGLGCLQ